MYGALDVTNVATRALSSFHNKAMFQPNSASSSCIRPRSHFNVQTSPQTWAPLPHRHVPHMRHMSKIVAYRIRMSRIASEEKESWRNGQVEVTYPQLELGPSRDAMHAARWEHARGTGHEALPQLCQCIFTIQDVI